MTITLDQARTIITIGLEEARKGGLKPLCIVVLDAGGHLKAFERQDHVPNRRFDIAYGKAYGAISIGVNSRRLGEIAVERPHLVAGVTAAIGGALVPAAGGVIALDDQGVPAASVGVSGDTSDSDEAIAVAGIRAAGLIPQE